MTSNPKIQTTVNPHLRTDPFRQDLFAWSGQAHLDHLADYQQLISDEQDSLTRDRVAGHFTASALLVDPHAGQVMLLMHPKVGRWLQYGGHIEPGDSSFAQAALRECREESGYHSIEVLPVPAALDRHSVPCAGAVSVHWDVQFLAIVDQGSERTILEDLQTRWFDLLSVTDVIPELDPSVQRLIRAAAEM